MRWLLCAVWVIFTFVASAQRDTIHHITVTQTDKFCQSGMDIDSCSYLPLYNSFYKWLGVPYRYSGDSKKGIDCSGLVKKVYREVYALDLNGSASDIYTRCEPIERKDLQEGDLVFFKINKSRISHVGIYLQRGFFVHASVSKGVMLNNLSEDYYKKYFFSGGRIKTKAHH